MAWDGNEWGQGWRSGDPAAEERDLEHERLLMEARERSLKLAALAA